MTEEIDLIRHRESLRNRALEKELSRLKNSERRKKHIILLLSTVLTISLILISFTILSPSTTINNSNSILAKPSFNKNHITNNRYNFSGVTFCIQLGAYSNLSLLKYKSNISIINPENKNGLDIITLGVFNRYYDAKDCLEIIKKIGFEDAFIMAYNNSTKISVKEAIDLTGENTPNELSANFEVHFE